MALITRLARLLRADLNAVMDLMETPDLLLAEAIREMEQALDSERRRLSTLERESNRLAGLDAELTRTLEETAQALEDCLDAEDEALARSVIARRLETERRCESLARQRQTLQLECEQLQGLIDEHARDLADLRARAALYACAQPPAPPPAEAHWSATTPPMRDAEIEVALLQAKRRREARS